MEEYPKNLTELEQWFSTEDGCREYLYQLRWPEGFRCPLCGHGEAWTLKGWLFKCRNCGHKASVIAAFGLVVPCNLVGDEPEKRSQCFGVAAYSRTGQL